MSEFLSEDIQLNFYDSVASIGKSKWSRVFTDDNPFTQFEYLLALEQSLSVCSDSGWRPQHLVITSNSDVIAILPCYEKSHSWGEYVFDWAWAEAYERNGLDYYPKLVAAIPFTPVSGQRIGMISSISEVSREVVLNRITHFLNQTIKSEQFSSWHCLFLPQNDFKHLSHSTISRLGTQFHWQNKQYPHFDDFLAQLVSRKRKAIKKERRAVSNFNYDFIDGDKASKEQWQGFVHCYQQTYLKRSGHTGYLNADFFSQIASSMGRQVRLLLVTNDQNNLIASALYFVSNTHLYGRYWGCLEEVDGLHFETCYYQGIEYAIHHGLTVFDAGAQGEHKVARGFEPVETYSNHEVAHDEFRKAIYHYCQQEQLHIKQYMQDLACKLPYKEKDNLQ
ncbi:GNAT family N-acetyltransferase [Shewanella sp. 10N.286.51.B7]|uniref:GNAT family N-acetyltransferase n=1 Tax=Shewanella sp. 10N.286.51.B7 TaxID=1880836 RepID=UPI000C858F75|nr:GNAT family N-acetyltransferase [Shewanella sp. 10N.286.51.B7]PMG75903.1 GNAT family N-acetyltransferase [Shewanella sp. 10N.286.51.B7]